MLAGGELLEQEPAQVRLPGRPDAAFTAGFHGSLSRDATLSVLATQTGPLPPAVRAGDVVQLFPELGPR